MSSLSNTTPTVTMNTTIENPRELEAMTSPQIRNDPLRLSSDRLTSDVETVYSETASAHKSTSLINKTESRGFDFAGSSLWEISSAAVGVVGIVLLVDFLIKVHGTPYADWQYTAAPNTIISIIMTITKATLLVPITACLGQLKWNLYRRSAPLEYMQAIDEASRGSWGSFQILYRVIVGARMGVLTVIGAFLTFSALAVDPFAQQIITFPSRLTQASNETAFIQYAHNYSSGIAYYYDDSGSATGLSPALPRAVMSGLSLSNFSLQPECSSGSCSYQRFVSLGICSQCKDVTEQTAQECQGDALELDGTFWVQSGASMNCTYTAPYGFNFTLNLQDISQGGDVASSQNETTLGVSYWSSSSRLAGKTFDIDTPIVSFITISQNQSIVYTSNNLTAAPPKPSLTECAIYWCEKEYAPTTYSGSAAATTISQTQQLRWGTDGHPLTPVPGAKSLSNESSSYYVSLEVLDDLPDVLQSVFNGTSYTIGYDTSEITPSLSIAGLLQMSNITEVLESISTRLTDTIRAAEPSGRISGTAFRDETFIQVRWPWIILPLCVVLGSALLLLATTVATRKGNTVL